MTLTGAATATAFPSSSNPTNWPAVPVSLSCLAFHAVRSAAVMCLVVSLM